MLKKIIYLNIVVFILVLIATIVAFYGYNYPLPFQFLPHFSDYGIQDVLLLMVAIAITSGLIAFLDIKNLDFNNKFFRITLLLNSLVLCCIIYTGFNGFSNQRKILSDLENEYIKEAKNDIKNDKVTFRYAGGLAPQMYDENTERAIDSLTQKYGVTYQNTECIIDNAAEKAKEKYEIIVKPYLDKRNGKDWEVKMKKEIKKIQEKSL